MSKAIDALREHFNRMAVPSGSKFLVEERDKVNSMIDDVEREGDDMTELLLRMHRLLSEKCDSPHEMYYGKPCESCVNDGSSDCPKIIAKEMRELGIEV